MSLHDPAVPRAALAPSGYGRCAVPRRLPTDGFLLLALLLYAPVGLCLLVLRLFIGVHVFLVSCILPDSVVRRCVSPGGRGAACGHPVGLGGVPGLGA